MTQSTSPLTPRSANRNALVPAEQRPPYRSPEKPQFAQIDTENIPLSSPNGPPSSPFAEDVMSSPERPSRSPSKLKGPPLEPLQEYQHVKLTEDALRENEGLTKTIEVMEDVDVKGIDHAIDDDTESNAGGAPGYAGMDDTAFSAFSAVPNADMARFARLGQSPAKNAFTSPTKSQHGEPTPRSLSRNTPSRNKHYDDSLPSPTLRGHRRERSTHDDDSTNLLVDFTGHFNPVAPKGDRSLTRSGRPSPRKNHNDLASYASGKRTPSPVKHSLPPGTPSESRHLANLLDFDLPPAPTPRSMPSISARELESMKSAFQSQLSSLKAELSGKEAEVSSLKNAMGDAERRVGEAQEQLREERGLKEGLQSDKTDWEKREQEMKDVLRSVKEEILHSDREKDRLMQRATEAEYKREDAELRAMEAESKIAGLQASSINPKDSSDECASTNVSSEVEAAVTKVAKELHGLYKSKHEAKVTALKKSYADRWEKKIKDLSSRIDELSKENEDLRLGRDATITSVDPAKVLPNGTSTPEADVEKQKQQEAELSSLQQRLATQNTNLASLQSGLSSLRSELATSKEENTSLHTQLDFSRAETADLIAATEELMALSQSAMSTSEPQAPSVLGADNGNPSRSQPTNISRSMSGSSGSVLKLPSAIPSSGIGSYSGESRIGGIRPLGGYGSSRERSGSGSRGAAKSGLLGSIERMGRGGSGH